MALLQEMLAGVGPRWGQDISAHATTVKDAYLPLLRAASKAGVTRVDDLAYGDHPRQVMDLYLPSAAADDPKSVLPVVVYVHGGAFVLGDKDSNGEMFGNVLTWFARQGYIGINLEYRLAGEAPYPGGAQDVAKACAYIKEHIARYGGDPSRICLIGHSAGGTHAAGYAYDPLLGLFGKDISHLVLLSARLRADAAPDNPNAANVKAYFGADESLYDERSPLTYGAASRIPVFIVTAEFENPLLDVYGLELALRIAQAQRKAPRYLSVRRHNHVSIVAHFNTDDEFLGREIMDFLDHTPGRADTP